MSTQIEVQEIRASHLALGDRVVNCGRVSQIDEFSNCILVKFGQTENWMFGKYDTVYIYPAPKIARRI